MLVLLFCSGRRYILLLDKKSFSSIDACRACILFHHPSCAETKRGSGFIGAEAFFVPSFLMISAGYFLMIFFDDDFLMVKSASIKHESTKLSVYCILKVYYLNLYIICNCACLLNLVHGNSYCSGSWWC